MQVFRKAAYCRLVAGILALLGSVSAAAGLLHLDVSQSDAGFQISADAHVDAAPAAVAAVLLDFSSYPALNPSIVKAHVVARTGPKSWRVRTATRGCVAGICRTVRQEQDYVRRSCWEITATLVPGTGNLQASRARWRLAAERGGTHVHWDAAFKPDFWLPPLVGKDLVARFLRRDSERFLAGLVRMAGQVDAARLDPQCTTSPIPPQS